MSTSVLSGFEEKENKQALDSVTASESKKVGKTLKLVVIDPTRNVDFLLDSSMALKRC